MKQALFIPKELTNPILSYLLDKPKRERLLNATPNHESGFVRGRPNCITEENDLSTYLVKIEEYLLTHYNITENDIIPETEYGCLISYSEDGHIVGKHKDKDPHENYTHTRFNFIISKPENGGDPIMDGEIYDMSENQVWVCPAAKVEHDITKVEGKKPRILLSYGYFLDDNKYKEIFPYP